MCPSPSSVFFSIYLCWTWTEENPVGCIRWKGHNSLQFYSRYVYTCVISKWNLQVEKTLATLGVTSNSTDDLFPIIKTLYLLAAYLFRPENRINVKRVSKNKLYLPNSIQSLKIFHSSDIKYVFKKTQHGTAKP